MNPLKMYHRPSLTKQWRNSVSNLLPLLNCLTNTHKNHEIFPHFATLKIAFLVTFLYIFLHNHKDMVNLKNIFFFKNHFSNFIIEKNGNFEGCLIGAVKPLKINGRLKTFMFTNIQGVYNICANFRLNLLRITIGVCWRKILGLKKCAILS